MSKLWVHYIQDKLLNYKKVGFLLGAFSIRNRVQHFSYKKDGDKSRRSYIAKKITIYHKQYLFIITTNKPDIDHSELSDLSNHLCDMLVKELSSQSFIAEATS